VTRIYALIFAASLPLGALAADAVPTEQDAVYASRAVKLEEQLRCLVCQNQTIAESNAELAQDLRKQVREQIAAGRTDEQIIDFMTTRYGDFVLYRPPLKATTVLLWTGPALLMIAGFVVLAGVVRKRRAGSAPPELTAEERERARRLLEGEQPESNA
jgi:cytochrome c-type biogenesis protein CcmH